MPAVISLSDAAPAAVSRSGSSVIIAQNGITSTLAPAGVATLNGHMFSAAATGGGVFVDGASTPVLPQPEPTPAAAIVVTANGATMTLGRPSDGNGAVVAGAGSIVTLQAGGTTTLGSQIIVAQSSGGGIVVGSSTFTVPSVATADLADSMPAATVVTANGATMTISGQRESGGAIVADAQGIITLQAGETKTLGSQTIAAPSNGDSIVIGSSTFAVPYAAVADSANAAPAATWTNDGQASTALSQSGSIVLQGAGSTTTLAPGSVATIAGQMISVPASASVNGAIVHDGIIASLSSNVPSTQATLVDNGITMKVMSAESGAVVAAGANSLSLSRGQLTVVHGETVSVLSTGAGLVVNGTKTVSLPPGTTPSVTTNKSGETAVATSTESGAAIEQRPVAIGVGMLLVCSGFLLIL